MKILQSIIVIPFAFIGGLLVGLIKLIILPFDLLITALCDIWEE